ncbi:protein kinase [Streptomyces sp. NPDC029554]|uniref:serine/threonine-protein kinase n=1 Tax=Streptomyces sp. NPDC029554 TaxID=3155126 RepID=UPI00340B5AA4
MVTGRYRLVESIGQGGMGRVWRAADEILDRQVAVKEMRIDGLDAEDSRTRRERTLREARATARIDHPNVVRIYDVVDEGERLWIVMELVAGRSLERVLAEEGPLGPCETARIGLGLVAALRQVHERGVLHRDIKPGNVLVEDASAVAGSGRAERDVPATRSRARARRVVLTDFGIAAIQDAKALTMVGMLVGSPDYMAPERISGRPQGPPSDIWSLGATLCAALGGRSPFSRDTTLATLHAVLYEEPDLPSAAGPLREILASLLEKDPSTRPTLEDLESALEPVAFPLPTPTVAVGTSGVGAVEPETGAPSPDAPDPAFAAGPYARTAPGPIPEPAQGPPVVEEEGAGERGQGQEPQAVQGQQPGPDAESERSERSTPQDSRLPTPPDPRRPAPAPSPVSLIRAHAETERRPHPTPSPAPDPMPPGELPGPATPRPRRTPHPGTRRRRTAFVAAAVTVATVGTAVGILLATSSTPPDDKPTRAGTTASASPTTTGTPATSPTASPTVEGTARPQSPPPGTRREAGGFAWAPPGGWRRDVKTGAEVHYTSPDGSQELVGKSSLARGDLLETWQTSERNAQQGEDYRKIRLEETTFRGHPAVVWEYTFTLKGVHWHARLLGFNVKGTSYQVNTWYDAAVEPEALRVYEKVKDSFTVL